MPENNFTKNNIFSYNLKNKWLNLAGILVFILIIAGLISYYFFSIRTSAGMISNIINTLIGHIAYNIGNATVLGALYTAFFGGLFFVILPIEAIFVIFISNNNPLLIIFIFLFGFFISYSINYFLGFVLAPLTRKAIPPKKFYKIKATLNRYGSWAVFGFNALPLPSQPLAAILGMFRYDRSRFYTLFLLGQFVKFTFISITYIYLF